jgi:hypothetical protein
MSPQTAAMLLRIASIGSFGLALIFASGAFAPLEGASRLLHDFLDFPLGDGLGAYTTEARWFSAIGGGVFASLAALFYLVVAPAIGRGDDEVRRGAILSILIWFVIDSAGSIAAGVPSNAAFNVFFLALFLGPLFAVKSARASRAQAA